MKSGAGYLERRPEAGRWLSSPRKSVNVFHVHQRAAKPSPETDLVRVSTPSQEALDPRLVECVRAVERRFAWHFRLDSGKEGSSCLTIITKLMRHQSYGGKEMVAVLTSTRFALNHLLQFAYSLITNTC